jgi:hypothetical protein
MSVKSTIPKVIHCNSSRSGVPFGDRECERGRDGTAQARPVHDVKPRQGQRGHADPPLAPRRAAEQADATIARPISTATTPQAIEAAWRRSATR